MKVSIVYRLLFYSEYKTLGPSSAFDEPGYTWYGTILTEEQVALINGRSLLEIPEYPGHQFGVPHMKKVELEDIMREDLKISPLGKKDLIRLLVYLKFLLGVR